MVPHSSAVLKNGPAAICIADCTHTHPPTPQHGQGRWQWSSLGDRVSHGAQSLVWGTSPIGNILPGRRRRRRAGESDHHPVRNAGGQVAADPGVRHPLHAEGKALSVKPPTHTHTHTHTPPPPHTPTLLISWGGCRWPDRAVRCLLTLTLNEISASVTAVAAGATAQSLKDLEECSFFCCSFCFCSGLPFPPLLLLFAPAPWSPPRRARHPSPCPRPCPPALSASFALLTQQGVRGAIVTGWSVTDCTLASSGSRRWSSAENISWRCRDGAASFQCNIERNALTMWLDWCSWNISAFLRL